MSETEPKPTPTSIEKLTRDISVAVDAAIGIVIVRAPITDMFQVQDAIYTAAMSQETAFRSWMMHTGWATYNQVSPDDMARGESTFEPMMPRDVSRSTMPVAIALLEMQKDKDHPNNAAVAGGGDFPQDGFFVMMDAFHYLEDAAFQSNIRNQAHRALTNGQRLFLIVPEAMTIPENIGNLAHIIDFEVPTPIELEASLEGTLEQIDAESRPVLSDEDVQLILSNSKGMTKSAFETAASIAVTEYSNDNGSAKGLDAKVLLSSLRSYKTAILRKTAVLELINPISMETVGGLENYKDWILTRKDSYSDEAKAFGITPAKGCLVVGPPGTGKSLLAKATCGILGLPGVLFDISKVFGSYIGQSETAMRTAMRIIDDMAPCLVFMDEIDKGLSGMAGGQNDGGTASRVFGSLLTWMQERDQTNRPVFVIMTANRVSGLPPELMRRGRIDEIWSVNVPNFAERKAIIGIHTEARGHELDEEEIAAIAKETENFVGAELEALIEGALNRDFQAKNPGLTIESLRAEKSVLKTMHTSFGAQLAEMQKWAKDNARAASKDDAESVNVPATVGSSPRKPLARKLRTSRPSKSHDA